MQSSANFFVPRRSVTQFLPLQCWLPDGFSPFERTVKQPLSPGTAERAFRLGTFPFLYHDPFSHSSQWEDPTPRARSPRPASTPLPTPRTSRASPPRRAGSCAGPSSTPTATAAAAGRRSTGLPLRTPRSRRTHRNRSSNSNSNHSRHSSHRYRSSSSSSSNNNNNNNNNTDGLVGSAPVDPA
ncbi:hypothetical protein VTK73DRAFT_4768 [Phialemonium thermophilum]|uniref:Uncharacterized protein n=1 Tax=Phialemonium thermophilum TaxID=223376 RepID=A0ABR3V5Z8_9PEZI